MDLEQEIKQLRSQLTTDAREEARLRSEADTLASSMKESGVNILADKDAFEKIDTAYAAADRLRDSIAEHRVRIERALEIAGERIAEGKDDIKTREAAGVLARLTESAPYQRLRESGVLNHTSARVSMDPVEIRTRDEFLGDIRQRTIDNSSGSGGGVIWSDRLENLIVPMAQRRVRLLDLITIGQTDTDTVEFVRQTTLTDNVSGQPYGTSLTESNYGWEKDSTVVKRRGHFVVATRGALADSAQLNTLLSTSLQRGHMRDIEEQAYKGNGAGENFLGITDAARTGVQTLSRSTDSYHDVFHKAITKVRVANLADDYEPSAFLINPVDYERIVLEKDKNDNYINNRGVTEISTLWGLVPIISTLAPSGSALVGDFTQAVMWLREGIAVSASDQHADFWLKGLVAIKSEGRAAFGVLEEGAFVKVSGL